MIKITKKFIEQFEPCSDRWQNYLNHYSEWSGTFLEFLELDKISSKDKVWVFSRNIPELEAMQREFSLVVACRAVNNDAPQEVQDLMNLILIMWEYSGFDSDIDNLKDDEYWAAYSAAYRAAEWAADRAAYRAADWAAEYDIFVEIIKNMLEE